MKTKLFFIIKKSDVLPGIWGDRKRVLVKKTGNMAAKEPTDKDDSKKSLIPVRPGNFFKSNVMYSDSALLLGSPYVTHIISKQLLDTAVLH